MFRPLGPAAAEASPPSVILLLEQRIDAARVHDHQHDVGGFRAELKAEAAAFDRVHRRRAPRSVERLAGATDHRAAAVAAADAQRDLRH